MKLTTPLQFSTVSEATRARQSLHGAVWPLTSPKTLNVDYAEDERVSDLKTSVSFLISLISPTSDVSMCNFKLVIVCLIPNSPTTYRALELWNGWTEHFSWCYIPRLYLLSSLRLTPLKLINLTPETSSSFINYSSGLSTRRGLYHGLCFNSRTLLLWEMLNGNCGLCNRHIHFQWFVKSYDRFWLCARLSRWLKNFTRHCERFKSRILLSVGTHSNWSLRSRKTPLTTALQTITWSSDILTR